MWLGGKTRDPQGYDMVGLFVGSEGTFGIATKIVVRILQAAAGREDGARRLRRGRPGLGGGVGDHRARAHARRDGDDRPDHDPGRRGRLRLRAIRATPRPRCSSSWTGSQPGWTRRPSASIAACRDCGRARRARGARRGGAPAPLEGAEARVRRLRPHLARLHGDGRRHPAHAAARGAAEGERDRRPRAASASATSSTRATATSIRTSSTIPACPAKRRAWWRRAARS